MEAIVCLVLVIATLIVYWQLRNHSYVGYDDPYYVTGNSHVQAGLTAANIIWAFTATHASNWHPLTWLSHMLDVQLYGVNPASHHMINVLFHIFNTLLLFFVLRRMTGDIWPSGFVAALFALHPLHVESVAWVAERKDVLSAFFWMLTLWGYTRYSEQAGVYRYLLVLLFFALGLMAKPMVVTLPFVLLLLDYWPLGRFQQAFRGGFEGYLKNKPPAYWLVLEKVPLFILAAASGIVTLQAQQSGGAVGSLVSYPLGVRISNALVSYSRYIGKMIWPEKLAVFYPHPEVLPGWQVIAAGLLIVSIICLGVRWKTRCPWFLVGWLWYLGTLVPVIGLIQVGAQAMADRYTYIPLIGLFIMVAWGMPEVISGWRFKRTAMVVAAGAIVSMLMIKTSIQVGYWQNSVVLFEHALDVTADNYLAHNNLGGVLEKQGRLNEAFRHYSEALRLHPNLSAAHNNIANILIARGKSDEAIHHYSEALRLKPNFALAHNNLGLALFRKGRLEEARVHFSKALQIRPGYHDAHKNLKITSDILRKMDTAVLNLKEALVIIPQDPLLSEKIERLNKGKRELDKVIDRFIKALSLQTGFAANSFDIHNLTRVHLIKQEYDQTFSLFEKLIKIQPDSAGAYYHIACIYARQNNTKESLDWLNQAIQRGFVNWELFRTDRDLENIRYTSFYKQLVEKH